MNPGGCYGDMARDTYGQSELWPKNFITFDTWSLILKKKMELPLYKLILILYLVLLFYKLSNDFFQNISKREKNICNSTFQDIIIKKSDSKTSSYWY